VPPSALRNIKLSFVGFDRLPHRGTIIVNAAVTSGVIKAFRDLYEPRFPIRRMQAVDAFHGSDSKSMASDNTSGFNCRYAVASGPPTWSMHAYGEAIDVNTVQNPYLEPGHSVKPPAGVAYVDRARLGDGGESDVIDPDDIDKLREPAKRLAAWRRLITDTVGSVTVAPAVAAEGRPSRLWDPRRIDIRFLGQHP
jgi:hypothetical protein